MSDPGARAPWADNAERVAQAESLVRIILEEYWSAEQIRGGFGFRHEANGYEHIVPEEERLELRYRYDEEALNIRFRPDALILQEDGCDSTHILIEYKTTTTPRYTFGDSQWDRGQIEADPWESYLKRINDGQRLAILNYCSFHPRPLLCDYPTTQWQVAARQRVGRTTTGSRTDYYNTELTFMRTFEQFMLEEFGVPLATSLPLIRNALIAILDTSLLQTRHDRGSPFFGSQSHRTSFNWEAQYRPA